MASEESDRVAADHAGMRLDKWLAARRSMGSRSKARQALNSGKVSVDGRTVGLEDAGRSLDEGSQICIAWGRPGTSRARTKARDVLTRSGVGIVHRDADIIVTDKPSGLLTDAADAEQRRNRDTLRKRIRALTGAQVWPAHRIDRDTTGLVVFATSEPVWERLMAQWRARSVDRVYRLVVEGAVEGRRGRWQDWMAWNGVDNRQEPCGEDHDGAFFAEANWRVGRRFGRRATALEVRLISGRRNQIRLQAQLRGHPLVGERQYRSGDPQLTFDRQALHAWRLAFEHPSSGARVRFEAPMPADLGALVAGLPRR